MQDNTINLYVTTVYNRDKVDNTDYKELLTSFEEIKLEYGNSHMTVVFTDRRLIIVDSRRNVDSLDILNVPYSKLRSYKLKSMDGRHIVKLWLPQIETIIIEVSDKQMCYDAIRVIAENSI